MNILEVINKHNFSTHSLAKAMDIKQSSVMSVVKEGANPTVNTLRNMAAAMKIPVWEFFADEMSLEDLQDMIEMRKAAQPQADDLPFDGGQQEPILTPAAAILCPHCGKAITLGVVK